MRELLVHDALVLPLLVPALLDPALRHDDRVDPRLELLRHEDAIDAWLLPLVRRNGGGVLFHFPTTHWEVY